MSAEEAPLVLLEINHTDLTSPIYVVNDTQDLTSNGHLYIACPFRCELPDELEGQMPRATLSVDNVGRDLMYWLENSGGGAGATVKFSQVMRSRPDTVEWSITLNLYDITCTFMEVSGELGYKNLLGRPGILVRYDPATAPGLF